MADFLNNKKHELDEARKAAWIIKRLSKKGLPVSRNFLF
jgi:hypothetical protein